jgi:hypothetical protein
VEEQHADFMRLVQEFDIDEQIPANLPSIAFHGAFSKLQQELQHPKYEPPLECATMAKQYKNLQYEKLEEFNERAREAENRLTQMESTMRKARGPVQQGPTASCQWSKVYTSKTLLSWQG